MSKLAQGCREYRSLPQISRRGALQAGLLGSFGLSLSGALRQEAQAANRQPAKAKSVILLWLQGGVSHHETFDPKPYAPADVRGEFGTISTNLPGVEIGELLPRMSTMMDKMAVVRSVTHREAAHQRGSIYMVEGRRPSPATGVNHSGNPELGSVIAHELGMRGGLPPFVSIPGNDFTSRFTGHGWLPATSACFRGYEAKTLTGSGEVALDRFSDRVGLRHALEGNSRTALAAAGAPGTWDAFSERAIDIITSGDGAAAFNIDEESDETKALYGLDKKSSDKGRLALTARRLVEAGVRYVTIGRHSWDHHSKIFPQLKSRLPSFDYAFTGLITDLEQRGLLDETLVVYMTEYGRTPKVNSQAGRDHWPAAFSIAFAGAGIRTGQVLGASDAQGAAVTDRPVSPEEIAATILHLAGVDPHGTYIKPDGRPIEYVDGNAQPVRELLA